ncbi:hypothetical protein EHQ53_08655 [Leptospira langatensis]|uniref:Uncharacterized protein n=1 Tax=Leptospira langatensis TaxID=2484983 RepID=A0A5F1ZWM6_9LEPT|nr:hypothetical protein [Leptospira langatensis]TGK01300.1 hypothetical protein EHO57_10215 [Leptospira langatensis]TGL42248.1 hypothetical protein EHQ53_08655 [Leptospira langatensis]
MKGSLKMKLGFINIKYFFLICLVTYFGCTYTRVEGEKRLENAICIESNKDRPTIFIDVYDKAGLNTADYFSLSYFSRIAFKESNCFSLVSVNHVPSKKLDFQAKLSFYKERTCGYTFFDILEVLTFGIIPTYNCFEIKMKSEVIDKNGNQVLSNPLEKLEAKNFSHILAGLIPSNFFHFQYSRPPWDSNSEIAYYLSLRLINDLKNKGLLDIPNASNEVPQEKNKDLNIENLH